MTMEIADDNQGHTEERMEILQGKEMASENHEEREDRNNIEKEEEVMFSQMEKLKSEEKKRIVNIEDDDIEDTQRPAKCYPRESSRGVFLPNDVENMGHRRFR